MDLKIRVIGDYTYGGSDVVDDETTWEFEDEAELVDSVDQMKEGALEEVGEENPQYTYPEDVAVLVLGLYGLPCRNCLNCNHDPFTPATEHIEEHDDGCHCGCHPEYSGQEHPTDFSATILVEA